MSNAEHDIIPLINKELLLEIPEKISLVKLKQQLTQHINHLINTDFEKLIFYLYRIDVHEERMKQLLQQQEGENAASLIAQLIIDRQLQKIKSRAAFNASATDQSNEERW